MCDLPILSNISDPTVNGFKIEWLDFNNAESYDIEHGKKGFQRLLQATIPGLTDKSYTFENLDPSTTYEFYIRSNCTLQSSQWNGPYFYNTVIDNSSSCNIDLNLEDNNCMFNQEFLIDIENLNGVLGNSIILESVALLIEHSWPPDLSLTLISPSDTEIILSSFNGNGIDNYGNPNDSLCMEVANFSDNACLNVTEWTPPFIGTFKPENSFSAKLNGEPPNGLWKLKICDRAAGDIGKLKYIRLNFSNEACLVPQDFVISDIEGDNITINWTQPSTCQVLKVSYKESSAPLQETFIDFIDCKDQFFTVSGLKPDTNYDLFFNAQCGDQIESPTSCLLNFRTACKNSIFSSSFDSLKICNTSCDTLCSLDDIWLNSANGDNWIVNSGETPTGFTGPESDISKTGNYVYIENQMTPCQRDSIELVSRCLSINEEGSCGISFNYHMFGNDIGKLALQYASLNGVWQNIWSHEGNQGTDWSFESIDLNLNLDVTRLRFLVSRSENSLRGDIALDQIKLFNADTVSLITYYLDFDNDGYGNKELPSLFCSANAPDGFVANADDCNDLDPKINPGETEINCNLIDENCNGFSDETNASDLSYSIDFIKKESCKGQFDGAIQLQIFNAQEPVSFLWSNGSQEAILSNVGTGIYTCSISDFGGCQIVTEPIFIDFNEVLVYSIKTITHPECAGMSNGLIELLVGQGDPPYSILWSNANEGLINDNLSDGDYVATITDNFNCQIITDPISIQGNQAITAGVSLKGDIECFGEENGFIQIGLFGGTPPYNLEWSNGDSTSFISNLSVGEYALTITDNNGCYNTLENINIETSVPLEVFVNNIENITCHKGFDGLIDIEVSGGTKPYNYFWSDGSITEDLFRKSAGIYKVTVNDFKACTFFLNDIIIEEPDLITIEIDSINSVKCSGSDDGFVSILVDGGTPPYSYNWNVNDGGQNSFPFLDQLLPGKYFLTVVDALGCKSPSASFEIQNLNEEINISLINEEQITCFGDSTGSIIAVSENGSPPFDFNWSSGFKSISNSRMDTVKQLIKGRYNLTITDNEGCIGVSDSLLINSPDEINYEVLNIVNNLCFDAEDGSIELVLEGGVSPYNLIWSDNQQGTFIENLATDDYAATITDFNNCESEIPNIPITSPSELMIVLTIEHPISSDGIIDLTVSGGTAPYQYKWGEPISFITEASATNLDPGNYMVTIIDNNNCALDTSINLQLVNSGAQLEKNIYNIFPNPSDGDFSVSTATPSIQKIQIINQNGLRVYEDIFDIFQSKVDIHQKLDAGVYFIRIFGKKNETIKLLII